MLTPLIVYDFMIAPRGRNVTAGDMFDDGVRGWGMVHLDCRSVFYYLRCALTLYSVC